MINPIKSIYQWNKEAGNLDKPYDNFLETSMSIEESLEGFNLGALVNSTDLEVYDTSPREVSRGITSLAIEGIEHYEVTDVEKVDKHIDNIIINFGSLFKVHPGITPQVATKMINVVMAKNQEKLKNSTKDKHGKIQKPEGFVGPEAELQKILDDL